MLAEPYSKRARPDGGRDFNLNADRWAVLLPHVPRAAWAKTVEKARKAAEKAVRKSARWKDEVSARSARRDGPPPTATRRRRAGWRS